MPTTTYMKLLDRRLLFSAKKSRLANNKKAAYPMNENS